MPNDIKVFVGIIGGTLLLIFGAAFLLGRGGQMNTPGGAVVDEKLLVKADSWKVGSDSAKVTVVEFSDFQCPACKAAQPVVKSLIAKYGDNLRFVYRHFPLPSHSFALSAAQAAEAAGRQGKFWEMHDILFANQPDATKPETSNNFQKDRLVDYAKQLNLDINKFSADLDSDATRQKVLNDQSDGNNLSVNATPTFFVNGKRLVGSTELEAEITKDLNQ